MHEGFASPTTGMLYSSQYPGGLTRSRFNIGYMLTQFDVLTALSQEQMRNRRTVRPEFATAVFENYCRNKLAKGKSRSDTSLKLEDLERGLPQFARSFQEARQLTGLPPSRLFPPLTGGSSSTSGSSSRRSELRGPGVAAAAGRNAAVVRVSDAPAPTAPGSSSAAATATATADPLSGEAVDPPPAYSRTDPEPEATRMLEMQLNQAARGSGGGGGAAGTVAIDGQDLAREERERRELEQAMRESEELEAQRRRRRGNTETGVPPQQQLSSRPRRQSSHSITNLSPRTSGLELTPSIDANNNASGGMDIDSPLDDPSRARSHRRAVSEAGGRAGPPVGTLSGLENGMQALAIPAQEQQSGAAGDEARPPLPQRATSNNPFLNPQQQQQQPMPPPPSLGAPMTSPVRSNSNNPFLDPQSPRGQPTSTLQRAGSVHTVYAPPPGPPPVSTAGSSSYAPPPGPPPGHISAGLANLPRRDPFEILASYDTVILVDDSGSMAGGRWREAKAALMEVAETASAYDRDGIDVYFMNDNRVGQGLTDAASVESLFNQIKPSGRTPTGEAIRRILGNYTELLEHYQRLRAQGQHIPANEDIKPLNLIVITDGEPSDKSDVTNVIVSVARKLDQMGLPFQQLGIQFVQLGNDSEAREYLEDLDDNLTDQFGIRDIVDTVPFHGQDVNADLIFKTLLGGINRKLDNRQLDSHVV